MFKLFNKRRGATSLLTQLISKLCIRIQTEFFRYFKKYERKLKPNQRIILVVILFILIISIQIIKLSSINDGKLKQPSYPPQRISTPLDITLPDSLDVKLIRMYKEMEKKHDSIK